MISQMAEVAKSQQALLMAGHKLEDIQKLNLVIDVEEEDDGSEEYAGIIEARE